MINQNAMRKKYVIEIVSRGTLDEKAVEQINTLIQQPAFCDCKVRIMPDVHAGVGCVIGFTADLGEKVP